jgi:rare lipoprotein A
VRFSAIQVACLLVVIVLGAAGCATSSPARPPELSPGFRNGGSESEVGWATYYAARFAGRPTATGEPYNPRDMTAAHRTLPFGTWIQVRRTDGRSVVVRVNDRGPYRTGRIVDLSRRAAEQLGMIEQGKVWVELRILHW